MPLSWQPHPNDAPHGQCDDCGLIGFASAILVAPERWCWACPWCEGRVSPITEEEHEVSTDS
jgi:hypothetical protein